MVFSPLSRREGVEVGWSTKVATAARSTHTAERRLELSVHRRIPVDRSGKRFQWVSINIGSTWRATSAGHRIESGAGDFSMSLTAYASKPKPCPSTDSRSGTPASRPSSSWIGVAAQCTRRIASLQCSLVSTAVRLTHLSSLIMNN